jgi:hypothetical protein
MTPKTSPSPTPPPSRRLWWIAGGAAALALTFLVGRFTAEPEPRPRPRPVPGTAYQEPAEPAQAAWPGAGSPAATPTGQAPPAPAAAPQAPPGPVTPERMQQFQAEMLAHVEETRDLVVERCVPRDGFPGGQRSGTLTYNVSFDEHGREIARGLVDDRRNPTGGAFGRCLQANRGEPFRISPPGRPISLRITVTYP